MKKLSALSTLLLMLYLHAPAQTAEDSVKTVVDKLFSAMKGADAAGIREVFADSALLQSIVPLKEGGFTVKNEAIPDFAASIAKLPKGTAG